MSYDVLADLTRYLSAKLGIPVSTQVPKNTPDEFVTIERTGGTAGVGYDNPNLAVQVWSTTDAKAYTLALAVRVVLLECWQELTQITRVEIGSIYGFPDPDSRKARYQIDVYLGTRL